MKEITKYVSDVCGINIEFKSKLSCLQFERELTDLNTYLRFGLKYDKLVEQLENNFCDEPTYSFVEKHDKNNITVNVVEYVNNNYTENLTLEFLKNKFFISYSTINRMFKQISGKTFKKYLNDLRLTSAHNMMIEDGNIMNVAKIAEMNGFKTYSTFYRDYLEKFGTPPSKMAHKKQESIWPMT